MACFTTQRAEADPFWPVFVATADALHLWSSGQSLDKRGFKGNWMNGLDVHRNDSKFIDHSKCPDTSLVDAKRWDVNTGKEGSRAGMDTWVAQVLEHHARALPSLQVDNPRGVSSDTRVDFEDRSKDISGTKFPPLSMFETFLARTSSTMSVAFSFAYFSRFSAKLALMD